MATLTARNFNKDPMRSSAGDASVFPSTITLSDAAVADVVEFARMPEGTEFIKIELVNDALGAGAELAVGLQFPDEPDANDADAFLSATSLASAGSVQSAFHPRLEDRRTRVVGTIEGAAATGQVTCLVHYRFVGTR